MPREECDLVRDYEDMHEDGFPSSWLREDMKGKAEEGDEKEDLRRKDKQWIKGG